MVTEESLDLSEGGRKSASALRTIGEVADELDLPQHVLRFWEKRFSQLKPVKRRGRRYYRPEDISLLHEIKALLYQDGFTIKGVLKFFEQRESKAANDSQPDLFGKTSSSQEALLPQTPSRNVALSQAEIELLQQAISRLEKVKKKVDNLLG